MARKQHKPEEIVSKLRQVEVLAAQGKTVAEGARAIGVTEATYGTSCSTRRRSTQSGKRRC
jgi:putative transposase